MAEAKRGLSSWLHKPTASLEHESEPAAAKSVATIHGEALDKTATSPLDISLAILRAKETINRISPDKRALVEEIDVEEDDAEFDEKAHWGRRSAASRRKKLKSGGRKAPPQPNYSIKAFCVPQSDSKQQQQQESEEIVTTIQSPEETDSVPGGDVESAAGGSDTREPQAKSGEENEEIGVDEPAKSSRLSEADIIEASSSVDGESAAAVSIESESMEVDADAGDGDSAKEPSADPGMEIVEVVQQVSEQRDDGEKQSEASPAVINPGRPKRQAAVKAQELSEQARKQTPALSGGGFITKGGAVIDLRTPPRKKPSKKNAKRSSSGSAVAPVVTAAATATGDLKTPVGRKRKLEMDKNTPSPGTKASQKESFFLTEQDKKQLQEIEAVAKLREQLRKTREKDLAFFSGKTAVNPFFQAPKTPAKSSSSTGLGSGDDVDGSGSAGDVIEIDEQDSSTPGTQERKTKSRWSKDAVHFPSIQHVFCADVDTDERVLTTTVSQTLKKKVVDLAPEVEIVVLDEDDEMSSGHYHENTAQRSLFAASSAHMQQQVHAEASFSDLFWFRQYLDSYRSTSAAATAAETEEVEGQLLRLRFPLEYESESALIDALVENYGIKEKRVREILDGLVAAKAKRLEKEQNLTFADRYTPVTASGIVGNKEPLRLLSSWLSAWKLGNDERDRRSCFQAELYVFEGDDSDEDELSDLCRLFILEGESGSGKSAAVYACAEELGYNVIEINAGQSRAGRNIVEIAGEATQSTRVLHMGNPAEKNKQKKKASKKKKRKSVDGSASHLSLVLFEDVDLVFEEDKGFLSSLCSIAKHSKCPIVLTCKELPDNFPATPQRLNQVLSKPSVNDFSAWMLLVAYLEQLPLTPALVETLATFFKCDIRQSLHFVQTHLPQFASKQRAAEWTWRSSAASRKDTEDASVDEPIVIDIQEDNASLSVSVVVPGWTLWPSRSFDMMSSNLLDELSACTIKPEEDKSTQEKVADAYLIESLSAVMDAVSVADTWGCHHSHHYRHGRPDDDEDDERFFDQERDHLKALDLRMTSLAAFLTPGGIGASVLETKAAPSSAECVKRSLDFALAEETRSSRRAAMNTMKSKMELPLRSLGAGDANPRFDLDYMPMISRILNSSASHQQSRRRASRRNHYLSGVISDMSLLDEIHEFTAFRQHADGGDQIVAASPSSSPLPS